MAEISLSSVALSVFLAVMFAYSWQLTLIALAMLTLIAVASSRFANQSVTILAKYTVLKT